MYRDAHQALITALQDRVLCCLLCSLAVVLGQCVLACLKKDAFLNCTMYNRVSLVSACLQRCISRQLLSIVEFYACSSISQCNEL